VSVVGRIGILVETLILFGPATLVLFLAPIGLLAALDSGPHVFLIMLGLTIGGSFGLFSVLHLASNAIDPKHRLPHLRVLSLSIALGIGTCIGILYNSRDLWSVAIFVAPLVGVSHLLWLCRRHFAHAA